VPSHLGEARQNLQFLQKGYYAKEALVMGNAYKTDKGTLL